MLIAARQNLKHYLAKQGWGKRWNQMGAHSAQASPALTVNSNTGNYREREQRTLVPSDRDNWTGFFNALGGM